MKYDEKIFECFFDNKDPLHLCTMPKKNKKKLEVIKIISDLFEYEVSYSEKEVNELLKPVFDDFVLLRRYLVDYSFLIRTNSGSIYRKMMNLQIYGYTKEGQN